MEGHDSTQLNSILNGSKEKSLNGKFLPFEMGYLTPFFQKKAETELGETPEIREKGLRLLWEMREKDELLNGIYMDDDFLIQYLRCRKYNVARAFSQIKSSYFLRRNNSKLFANMGFERMSISIRDKFLTFLPYRCPDGCAILLVELNNWNPEIFSIEEIKSCVIVLLMQSLRDPMTQVNGFKVIFDVKSNPLKHLRYCTPSNLYLLYHGTQECAPGRFKEIHMVNDSVVLKTGWLLMKNFMSAKFKKRMIFHSRSETLLDYFPRDVLPVKYGGYLQHYDLTDWLRKVTQPEMLATIPGSSIDNM